MVAPLTTALMRSVPGRQAGLASAINNAISRVGPQLAGALIFIVVTASFYSTMATLVPGLDTNSADVRAEIPPINRPADGVPPEQVAAARQASTDAFHLAMLSAAALMVAGAATNWLLHQQQAGDWRVSRLRLARCPWPPEPSRSAANGRRLAAVNRELRGRKSRRVWRRRHRLRERPRLARLEQRREEEVVAEVGRAGGRDAAARPSGPRAAV